MKIQLYVDGKLAYDNYLPEEKGYNVDSIAISEAINKGGTATVILPQKHPKYDSFRPYSVPVEIYRDNKLRWRGRPLPLKNEDFYGRRTIICEGELCFLQDAIHRPYAYSTKAEDAFTQIITTYNAAVDPWKRFSVGVVTVVGNADISSKNPENCLEALQRLISACGGFILFDTAPDGSRRINWYSNFPYTCNQTVKYGSNLTDYNRQDGASDFATRIIPYGAIGENGERIQINVDGKDYVENEEAVATYGVIEKANIYNDISDLDVLLINAQKDVAVGGMIPATIKMSAIDMSRQDLSLDAFAIGQQVPAESAVHNLSGYYYLTGLTEDLVNPKVGGISLQRDLAHLGNSEVKSLTSAIAVSRKGMLNSAGDNAAMTIAGITHEFVFNKLTNNGAIQGLYEIDGQLYINASYLKSGVLDASLIKAGELASADRKIVISLNTGSSGPIFNTGISTNGITVRGDEAGAATLFTVEVAEEDGVKYAYLSFYDISGNRIISLAEDASRTGGGLKVKNDSGTLEAIAQATDKSAGFRVLHNGTTVAYLAVDSEGNSVLQVDEINCKKINGKTA